MVFFWAILGERFFRRTTFPRNICTVRTVPRISQIKTDSWYYTRLEGEDLFLLVERDTIVVRDNLKTYGRL